MTHQKLDFRSGQLDHFNSMWKQH